MKATPATTTINDESAELAEAFMITVGCVVGVAVGLGVGDDGAAVGRVRLGAGTGSDDGGDVGAALGENVSTETESTVMELMSRRRRTARARRRREAKLLMFASSTAPLLFESLAVMCSCALLPSAAATASGNATSVEMYTPPSLVASVHAESENVPSPSPIVASMPFWKMVASKSVHVMPPRPTPVWTIGIRVGAGVGSCWGGGDGRSVPESVGALRTVGAGDTVGAGSDVKSLGNTVGDGIGSAVGSPGNTVGDGIGGAVGSPRETVGADVGAMVVEGICVTRVGAALGLAVRSAKVVSSQKLGSTAVAAKESLPPLWKARPP